jgi:hypothetical protein
MPIALLDANTFYPAPVRDLLLQLADVGLYAPKWTEEIHEEWIRNLLINRPELKEKSLLAAKDAMNSAFPDANVSGFHRQKDFPREYVKEFAIRVVHTDDFIANLIHTDTTAALRAFDNQLAGLKNPPLSEEEVLDSLKKCGLKISTVLLGSLIRRNEG